MTVLTRSQIFDQFAHPPVSNYAELQASEAKVRKLGAKTAKSRPNTRPRVDADGESNIR